MHVNDTFGTAMKGGIGAVMPKFDMPYKIVETIAYDPAARDLSVEVAKAKATGAEALLVVSRLNDAILLTREMVKQRWTPMAILSMGPGWYEDQYLKTLGKLSDGPLSFVPWYDPNKKLTKQLEAALAKAYPGRQPQHQPRLHLRGAADRRRRLQARRLRPIRRRWPTPSARPTSPTMSASAPASSSTPRARTTSCKIAAIQNRGGKLVTVAPKAAANAKAGMAAEALRQARLTTRVSRPSLAARPASAASAAGASGAAAEDRARCRPTSISTSPSAAC